MKGRILAVSWAMPPLLFPRSLQISRLLEQWSLSGWQTSVLAVDPVSMKGSVPLDPDLVALYEKYYSVEHVGSSERSFIFRLLFRLIPFLKECPDEKWLWADQAAHRGVELHTQNKFDLMVSFAQPWSSHRAGLKLYQATGLPWIAHFSDPWTVGSHSTMTWWAARQARKLEAQVVEHASRLIFVNQQTLDATMAQYPVSLKKKARVIAHGYDTAPLAALTVAPATGTRPLTLVHSGHFYGRRAPWAFLQALSEIHRKTPLEGVFQVLFVGVVPPEFLDSVHRLGLGLIVKSLGPKRYLEALQTLREADVLLLIEAASPQSHLYFPSKLVDYLLFQKPILGLTPAKGLSASLLTKLQCPIVDPDDTLGISRAIKNLLEQKQAGPLRVSENFSGIAQKFDIKNTAKEFLGILQDVLKEKGIAG